MAPGQEGPSPFPVHLSRRLQRCRLGVPSPVYVVCPIVLEVLATAPWVCHLEKWKRSRAAGGPAPGIWSELSLLRVLQNQFVNSLGASQRGDGCESAIYSGTYVLTCKEEGRTVPLRLIRRAAQMHLSSPASMARGCTAPLRRLAGIECGHIKQHEPRQQSVRRNGTCPWKATCAPARLDGIHK